MCKSIGDETLFGCYEEELLLWIRPIQAGFRPRACKMDALWQPGHQEQILDYRRRRLLADHLRLLAPAAALEPRADLDGRISSTVPAHLDEYLTFLSSFFYKDKLLKWFL